MKRVCKCKGQKFAGRSYSSGFTLVELMVALTLMTLVTLIIGNGFRLGMDAWDRGEAETGLTQRYRVLTGMFSQQLTSAYPYGIDVDEEKLAVFKGDDDSFMFVTTITDSPFGGFKWIRYSFKNGTLFYKEGILPDKDFEDKITGNEEIVDSDVGEMKFTYYSKDEGDWKDSWDYGENLPGAVKIEISNFEPFLVSLPMSVAKKDDEEQNS